MKTDARVELQPLQPSDREQFIHDNQEAFNYGALEEFGRRDDHFEEDGEIISHETIEASIDSGEAYRILLDGEKVGGVVLKVGGERAVAHTIVNALAITSGIVCDGAKSSCAAKIAMAVEAGIFGYEMYLNGQQFYGGDGLVVKGVENSIASFSRLARVGMKETDQEIIRMMTEWHREMEQRLRRPPCRPPLVRVPVLCHKIAGTGIDLHHSLKILLC